MTHFKSALTFILLTIGCMPALLAQSYSYTIQMDNPSEKKVHVEAELYLIDSDFYMSPNGPVTERWDDFVENVSLENRKGEALTITKNGDKWVTDAKQGQWVKLRYTMSVTHDEIEWPGGIDGVAFVNDSGYFMTGRSLFIMNGEEGESIEVAFNVPENHKVSTPWQKKRDVFVADNFEALTESLIMAGKHESHTISQGDLEVLFVLAGQEVQAQSEQFKSIAQQTMNYYIDMMGGTPVPSGNEMANIMVTINQSQQTDGEVIGGHISMLLNPDGPPQQQMVGWFMFAHEFFHLWNGKTLRVESTRDDWFKEGITNYYTLKSLYQIGFINEQALAGIFNGLFYQRYQNDSGLGEMSMRDAAEGFDKDNHWGLIYGGGLFAGIALDVMIREHTENEKSLDDVMRTLYDKYAGKSDYYTTEEIKETIAKISGLDTSDFFATYINGSKPIPVEDYLVKAGFDVQLQNGNLLMSPKEKMNDLEANIHQGFLGK